MAHLRRYLLSKYRKTHINENPNGGSPLLGFFLGGALVSARLRRLPEQEVHQPSNRAPTAQKCTIYFVGAAETAAPPGSAPTAQKCTIYLVGAAETAAPPGRHQPSKNCTNRANHKRLCWGAWVWQGCHTLLQLLALMRFEPVLAPTGVCHERHVQRIGVLHLFDNNLFYTLLLLRQDGEVEFVVHLQNHP